MSPVPGPVARVAELMLTFPGTWALCGGWAVDAWLGRQTREHEDVDVAMFKGDQRAIFEYLAGWQLIAHDPNVQGDTSEPWDGRTLDLPAHIHARWSDGRTGLPHRLKAPTRAGFGLDIQVSQRAGSEWVFSREPRVTMPLERSVQRPAWGGPTLVPEVLLLYKARDTRPHDEADFLGLLPGLSAGQRSWLRDAISLAQPRHPWLAELAR